MKLLEQIAYNYINHYDEKFFWKKRQYVIDCTNCIPKMIKLYWLIKLKKMESYNNASLGTYINHGAIFDSKPTLPHGLRGIHVSDKAHIGRNCTIYQHCTIGVIESKGGAPNIGDNCILGAGSMILGNIIIGNNVRIGANCVVNFDVPDNCTIVAQKTRIIKRG